MSKSLRNCALWAIVIGIAVAALVAKKANRDREADKARGDKIEASYAVARTRLEKAEAAIKAGDYDVGFDSAKGALEAADVDPPGKEPIRARIDAAKEAASAGLYAKAKDLLQKEDLPAAADILKRIGAYKDAPALLADASKKLNYAAAQAAEKVGDLEKALGLYKLAGDYQDSSARAADLTKKLSDRDHERAYTAALDAIKAGDLDQAAKLLSQAGDWKDAAARLADVEAKRKEKKLAAEYAAAQDAIKANDLDKAKALLQPIGSYMDAADLLKSVSAKIDRRDRGYDELALDVQAGDFAACFKVSEVTYQKPELKYSVEAKSINNLDEAVYKALSDSNRDLWSKAHSYKYGVIHSTFVLADGTEVDGPTGGDSARLDTKATGKLRFTDLRKAPEGANVKKLVLKLVLVPSG